MAGNRRARLVLAAFLLTFMAARVLVFLIMARRLPDMYFYLGGTHIHHLNYGIVLLSFVGAFLLFAQPTPRQTDVAAVLYGIGLALTFDEFGMWVHLGGGYWQRASFDAVCVIAALLGLIAVAPRLREFRTRQWLVSGVLGLLVLGFGVLLADSTQYARQRIGLKLETLEQRAPQ